jgi:serine/threonine-protein kinase
MAPEQLAGKEATKQSDLYALGLVLYELFTGKAAFEAKSVEEFLRVRAATPTTTPSTLIPDIGPRVEGAILRCLEPDSAQRPASALDVAALLPGGDPLAEALAAGETPSPEMVAAAGPTHVLSPRLATGLLAAIAVSLVAAFWLTGRSQMLNQLSLEYPPEVLVERAREIVRVAGYRERAADSAFGFESDSRYVRYFDDTLAGSQRDRRETWTSLLSRSPSPLTFWYIHSASPLVPLTSELAIWGRVERDQPLIQRAAVLVELDPDGRLRRFVATRMDRDTASDSAASVDWSALFSTAGLDFSRFTPDSRPASADTEVAWTGVYPGHDNLPVKVEARSQGGHLMQFAVLFPWTEREDAALSALGLAGASGGPVTVLVNYVFIIAIVLVAYRNWKIGRADLTGASRVALFIGTLLFLIIVMGAHDRLTTLMYQPSVPIVAFDGLIAGLTYIALEPWVRRSWPQAMVTWSRVLAGRWRDPVVARDILIGIALAVVIYCFRQSLYAVFMPGRGMPPGSNAVPGFAFMPAFLTGGRVVAAGMLAELTLGLIRALSVFFLLFLCRVLLPRPWMSVVALVAAAALLSGVSRGLWWSDTRWIDGLFLVVVFSLLLFPVLFRFGFVTFAVWGGVGGMLQHALVTNQFGAWYGQSSLAVLVVITAVTLWAFWTSIGRPAIGVHEPTS